MSNLVIPNGGNIGSASDPDAISIASDGNISLGAGIVNGNFGTITQRSSSSSSPTFTESGGTTIVPANLYSSTSEGIGGGTTHAWLAWDYGAGNARKITKVQGKFHGQTNNTGIFLEGSNVVSPNASAGHSDWTQLKSFGAMTNGQIYLYSAPVTATTLKYRHYRFRLSWSSSNSATIEDFVLEDTDSTFDARTALNATGDAPIYACRAWVNFNGSGTLAVNGSANVSSVTDDSSGHYTINFTTAMSDANYCFTTGIRQEDPNYVYDVHAPRSGTLTASALQVETSSQLNTTTLMPRDTDMVCVAIFR